MMPTTRGKYNTMKKLSETYRELGIAFTFPIDIKNADGNPTYSENSNGFGGTMNTTRTVKKLTSRTVMAIGVGANTTRTATKPTTRPVLATKEEPSVAPAQARLSRLTVRNTN
jgi:hypothetical protein